MVPADALEARAALWASIGRLVDRAPSMRDLRAHRLHLLAAEHWRRSGRPVPPQLALEELVALQRAHSALQCLRRLREVHDGRLVVLKGPAVAARWPVPHLRPSSDVDVLAEDPEAAQRALLANGFRPAGPYPESYYDGVHHLRPLQLDGAHGPLVEIHRRPNWVEWADSPPVGELLEMARPARLPVEGLLELPPAAHALALAAHSWGELPLRRLSDFLDIHAVVAEARREEADALARRWGLAPLWTTSVSVADALFAGGAAPTPLRTWGRNLAEARDAMVFERHVRRWASPFWVLPARRAVAASLLAVLHDLTPTPEETWSDKLVRYREALLHPTRPMDEHRARLGPRARKPRLKRRT